MEANECQQLFITGRCIFEKSRKYNYLTATKKQVECIKDKLKRIILDPLGITVDKNITMAQ